MKTNEAGRACPGPPSSHLAHGGHGRVLLSRHSRCSPPSAWPQAAPLALQVVAWARQPCRAGGRLSTVFPPGQTRESAQCAGDSQGLVDLEIWDCLINNRWSVFSWDHKEVFQAKDQKCKLVIKVYSEKPGKCHGEQSSTLKELTCNNQDNDLIRYFGALECIKGLIAWGRSSFAVFPFSGRLLSLAGFVRSQVKFIDTCWHPQLAHR